MAQPLSKEEFHRMQAQLLDLRTQNYQQSDDLRKNTAELNAFRQKTFTQKKDLTKALKEIDTLLSENEMLHGKLHSQEEDFRLQNSTLMQELSKGAVPAATNPASSPIDGELLRLQAENSALQKNMAALQERYEREVQSGRGSEVNGLRVTHTDHPDGQSHTEEEVPGQTDNQEGAEISEQRVKEQSDSPCSRLRATASEDNAALGSLQASPQEPSQTTRVAGARFLRLQTEKETLYTDSRTKIEEIQQKKEEELKSVNVRNQKLQADLQATNQVIGELKEQLQNKQKDHEVSLNSLKEQVACQSAESQEQVESILTENDALRTNLAALEQIQTTKTQEMNLLRDQNMALIAELQQHREDQESFLAQKDDLHSQLQEATRVSGRLLEQLTELEQEKEKLQKDLEEMHKTADKRKAMLDEMAIGTAQEKSRHKEEMSDVRLQHEKEVLSRSTAPRGGERSTAQRGEEERGAQLREERRREEHSSERRGGERSTAQRGEEERGAQLREERRREEHSSERRGGERSTAQRGEEERGAQLREERRREEHSSERRGGERSTAQRGEEERGAQLREERRREEHSSERRGGERSTAQRGEEERGAQLREERRREEHSSERRGGERSTAQRGEEERGAQLQEERRRGAQLREEGRREEQSSERREEERELEGLQQIVEELKLQIQSMEGTKGWFERRLREAEETIEKNLLEKRDEVRNLHKEHAAQLQEKDSEIERVKQQMGEVEKERDDQVTTISSLKQLKDLKRQLQLERKRADKLQERLQEIFTNSKTKTGLEELVLSEIRSPSHTQTGDSSSISSFSYREMMKEGTAAQSSSKRWHQPLTSALASRQSPLKPLRCP
ncbi:UNVERIFIED_CONTAM: hypothetical protein FKN15_025589 [Acipenser sinensis]